MVIDVNGGLEYFNFSWNYLWGKGGIVIGRGFCVNCSLKIFNLFWNGFVDEGVVVVGELFKENNIFIDIDLINNWIFI